MNHYLTSAIKGIGLAVSILLLERCTQDETHNGIVAIDKVSNLQTDTAAKVIPLSNFTDSISYIKLSQAPLPIGRIDKIIIADNKVFVLDRDISKSLFVFDGNGQFLYNVGSTGGSLPVTDFFLNQKTKYVFVYSAVKHLIEKYNIETGKKEDETIIEGYFHEVNMLDTSTFVLIRDGISRFDNDPVKYDQNRICLFDRSGKYLKGYLNKPLFKNINFGAMHAEYSPGTQSVKISRLYSDTVYTLTQQGLSASYALNLINATTNSDLFSAEDPRQAESFCHSDKFSSIWGSFFETNDVIAFYYTKKGLINLCWRNKKDHRQYDIAFFENDIDNFPDAGMVKYIDDDNIISVMQPIQLLNAYNILSKTKNFQTRNKKFITVMEGIQAGSNPVIAVQHLKKQFSADNNTGSGHKLK